MTIFKSSMPEANASDGVYDEAEREVIEALKKKSAELGKEAAILDQRLPKLEREAQQSRSDGWLHWAVDAPLCRANEKSTSAPPPPATAITIPN